MTQAQERRKHPRLPLHLSVAKLVDFQVEGFPQPAPAILVDISAGGLSMICFSLPTLAQKVSFKLDLPGVVNAQLNGSVVRIVRKGETYQVAIAFNETQDKWSSAISKLAKSYVECQKKWDQGERKHCPKDCAYHKAFARES